LLGKSFFAELMTFSGSSFSDFVKAALMLNCDGFFCNPIGSVVLRTTFFISSGVSFGDSLGKSFATAGVTNVLVLRNGVRIRYFFF
jgi:hypothetical protein